MVACRSWPVDHVDRTDLHFLQTNNDFLLTCLLKQGIPWKDRKRQQFLFSPALDFSVQKEFNRDPYLSDIFFEKGFKLKPRCNSKVSILWKWSYQSKIAGLVWQDQYLDRASLEAFSKRHYCFGKWPLLTVCHKTT